ncbi:MAG: chlorohydrolase family protein [Eubacteriales bacterium]|nr:chlorohydrolase family protein [Eubacteriales bacterium]
MITLIKSQYLLAYSPEQDNHELISQGELAFEDHEIIYVGKAYSGHYDKLIDASDKLVAPGFVDLDALGDIDHTLLFYEHPAESRHELEWSQEYFKHERKEEMSAEDEAFKSLFAYVSLIRNGITTAMPITSVMNKAAGETYAEIEAAAKHAAKLGLRVYLGPSYLAKKHVLDPESKSQICLDLPPEELERGLADAEKFIKNYHNSAAGLIQAVVVPERIELQTEDSLKRSKALARKYDLYFRLHAAQGKTDYSIITEKYGCSPIQYLDSINLLDEKTLIPHCTYSSGCRTVEDRSNRDQEILRQRGTTAIHCPLVYARFGAGLDSFGRFIREGVKMAMGTDTFPPDPFIVIRTGQATAKLLDQNRAENSLEQFYRAFTIGGADALGRKDLGRLAVGAKADLIMIDLSRLEAGVIADPIQTLCLAANGGFVDSSIINGRIVMENREIPGIDLAELKSRAQEYFQRMKHAYYKRSCARDQKSEAELFHKSFPEKA